jgi:hypothetical protein
LSESLWLYSALGNIATGVLFATKAMAIRNVGRLMAISGVFDETTSPAIQRIWLKMGQQ